MGIDIDREHFSEEDYRRFGQRLERSLEALGSMLARPGFGTGERSVGARWRRWSPGLAARGRWS